MTEATTLSPRAFTVAMLAERWGTSDQFVYDQISRGKLRAMRLGGKLLRIRVEDVAAFEDAAILAPEVITVQGDMRAAGDGLRTAARLSRVARRSR